MSARVLPTDWASEADFEQVVRLATALVRQLDDPQTRINSAALAVKEHLRARLEGLEGASRYLLSGEGGPASPSLFPGDDGHVNGADTMAPEGPRPLDDEWGHWL